MKNQFPRVFLWKNCLNIAQSIHITKSVWNFGRGVITTQLYQKDKTENTKMQIHKPDKKHFIIDFNLLFYYCFFFSQTIQVFGNVLCGNLDGACFRYMMLMCDFITVVEWKEVEDFRAFAHVVYPFMGVSFWSSSLL